MNKKNPSSEYPKSSETEKKYEPAKEKRLLIEELLTEKNLASTRLADVSSSTGEQPIFDLSTMLKKIQCIMIAPIF